MSTHSQPTPARPDSTDSPTPTDTAAPNTAAGSDRSPATFDPGCRRRLANLVDGYNSAMPRMNRDD